MPSIVALLAAVAALPIAPPAPPAPPVIISSSPAPRSAYASESPRTLGFDVAVSREGKSIWSGVLRMASNDGASILQQNDQTVSCGQRETGRVPVARLTEKLRVQLRGGYSRDKLRIQVEWQRPGDPAATETALCEAAVTRTVTIDAEIEMDLRRPLLLNGDGGLAVRIAPR